MPIEPEDPYAMPPEFVFPKNLKALSENEREELYRSYVCHTAKPGSCELSPSEVLDPDSNEYKAKVFLKKIHAEPAYYNDGDSPYFEFDPVLGYIVPDEDLNIVGKLSEMSDEDKAKLMQKGPRHISDQELEMAKMAVLPPVLREIEERFFDI